jgi:hypothetical protein
MRERREDVKRDSHVRFLGWLGYGNMYLPQVTDGLIVDGGDIDGGQGPRVHEPSQLYGITTVGFDPVDGLFGNSCLLATGCGSGSGK